jgi:hypothetical protein
MSQLIDRLAGDNSGAARIAQPAIDIGALDEFGNETDGSYVVNQHQYPVDLGSEKYGKHRVLFFINVNGGGSIARNTPGQTVDLPKARYPSASGTAASKIAEQGGRFLAGTDIDVLRVLQPKKRLVSAISLYVPETLTKSYGVDWGIANSDEMMQGETIAQVILTGQNELGKYKRGEEANIGNAIGNAAKPIAGQIAAKLLNGMKYAQKSLGISPGNSKAELLFNSVDFNQFTFDYRFAPKTEQEAANVLNIIRTFRHHMLPEYFDQLNYLYIYPSEFEVRYYRGTEENTYLEHHMTAVLKNMTINYNPNGQFMTFANGMPTHINMTLQFQELAVPTKETSPSNRSGA